MQIQTVSSILHPSLTYAYPPDQVAVTTGPRWIVNISLFSIIVWFIQEDSKLFLDQTGFRIHQVNSAFPRSLLPVESPWKNLQREAHPQMLEPPQTQHCLYFKIEVSMFFQFFYLCCTIISTFLYLFGKVSQFYREHSVF